MHVLRISSEDYSTSPNLGQGRLKVPIRNHVENFTICHLNGGVGLPRENVQDSSLLLVLASLRQFLRNDSDANISCQPPRGGL